MPIHTPNGTFYRNDDPADRAALRARLEGMRPKPLTPAQAAYVERKKARDAEIEHIRVTRGHEAAMEAALSDIDAAFAAAKAKREAA